MPGEIFTLDLNETFPRLSRPPIVEAAIHWQARAQQTMEPEALRSALGEKLPMYPRAAPLHGFGPAAALSPSGQTPVVEHQSKGIVGWRLTSADGHTIVQILRDGLVFSVARSYEHWERFASAAKQAWQVYLEVAAPIEIHRLGVRFINHFPTATSDTLHQFLAEPPICPSNLPLQEFVYQSTFTVPGKALGVRVIKVMQPSMPELKQSSGLFLDIDVYSTKAIPNEFEAVDEALRQMRWLKNKIFFTLVTENAVELFQ